MANIHIKLEREGTPLKFRITICAGGLEVGGEWGGNGEEVMGGGRLG